MEAVLAASDVTLRFLTGELRTPEMEERVQAFKEKYFGAGGGRAFAAWKYRNGPVDCGDCEIIAQTPDGSIVGHLGAVIFPSVPGSSQPWLALGTEFVVDEKYRGGGHDLIRKLDSMLGERIAEKGVRLLYGLPNKVGYVVAKRLYRRANGVECAYLSKVFTSALAAPRGKIRNALHRLLSLAPFASTPLPAGWSWDQPASFQADAVDGFCREFMRSLDFGAARNARFLNWRYGGGDGQKYENVSLIRDGRVIGLAVIRINPARCEASALMECMALDPQGYDVLLGVCMRLARRRSPALIAYGVKRSPAMEACLRAGFIGNAERLERIGRALNRFPAKLRERFVAKAENHFHADDYSTLFYYPEPKRSAESAQGRWYLSLGEKTGF